MGYRVCEEDLTIVMTRGDTVKLTIGAKYKDSGELYVPEQDDIIRFSVKKYLSDKTPAIVKDVSISSMLLTIDPEDTKDLSFGNYHYDVQLIRHNGDTDTFIEDRQLILTAEVF